MEISGRERVDNWYHILEGRISFHIERVDNWYHILEGRISFHIERVDNSHSGW